MADCQAEILTGLDSFEIFLIIMSCLILGFTLSVALLVYSAKLAMKTKEKVAINEVANESSGMAVLEDVYDKIPEEILVTAETTRKLSRLSSLAKATSKKDKDDAEWMLSMLINKRH